MTTGLYLHIPFCSSRCSYCDFNTYVGLTDLFEPYAQALAAEVRRAPATGQAQETAETIFFGGGTPSLLAPSQIGALIEACTDVFDLPEQAELTMEANPGTVTADYLGGVRAHGINRLSFGAQSADPTELKLLGREHDWAAVASAVTAAREVGFANINVDLIFGLPYQSLEAWQRTVQAALALSSDHISLYALTIETGTPMFDWTRRGEVPFPDPDVAADMYDYAEQTLGQAGFMHYEISNWCKPGHACQHNLIYWRNEPYHGLGAGAHGSTIVRRRWNVKRPAEYIARIKAGQTAELDGEDIDVRTSMGETMLLGLRLLDEGVEHARFEGRYGTPLTKVFGPELDEGLTKGLIEIDDVRVRLTARGRFISNQVMKLFV